MMTSVKIHHLLGVLSIVVGLSYLFEQYSLVSKALQGPFMLLGWLPGLDGQQWWGLAFTLGGSMTLLSWNVYVRAVCLVAGALCWGFFGASSLYVAFLSDGADSTGGYAGLMCTFVVVLFLWACSRIREDFPSPSAKVA